MDGARQITIAEWQQWKQEIKDKLNQTVENFIAIGYRLRQIQETESYRNDNFTSLSEWAKSEFGLSESTVTRFMAISTKFTVDGGGTELLPEFTGISYSKLQEMLTLSDEDCRLITANTTVKEIRELKQFNHDDETKYIRTEEEKTKRTPLQECVWDFFSQPGNKGLLDEVLEALGSPDYGDAQVAAVADTISPSGNRTHRKGIVYLFMYDADRGVAYKLMTSPMPVKMTWEAFLKEVRTVYAPYADAAGSVWETAYRQKADPEAEIPGQLDILDVAKETENGLNPKYGGGSDDLDVAKETENGLNSKCEGDSEEKEPGILVEDAGNGLNPKCGGDFEGTVTEASERAKEDEETEIPGRPLENVTAQSEIVEAADKTSIFKVKEVTGNAGSAEGTGNTGNAEDADSAGYAEGTGDTDSDPARHGTDQPDQPGRDGDAGKPEKDEEVAGTPESGAGGNNGCSNGSRKDPVGQKETAREPAGLAGDISGEPENGLNGECGGHFGTEEMSVIDWKNLWMQTAESVYTLRHFFYMDYEKLNFIDNAIPKKAMEKAYNAAINIAAGLEKMLNGKKYSS